MKSHASVCTGFGASELAASWLGWNNIFMSEIEEFCRTVLAYHFPNTKLYGDFTKENFTKYRGLIDVFTAGFPCQPFSVAGERNGADDHRYLWPQVHRLVEEIRPTWFIGENVDGLASMVFPSDEIGVESQANLFEASDKEALLDESHILGGICADLEEIGYSVQPIIIPACSVGAPHRRYRIFIIAHSNSHDAGGCRFRETESETEESKEQRSERERVRHDIERNDAQEAIADTHHAGTDIGMQSESFRTEGNKGRSGFSQPEFRQIGSNEITPNTECKRGGQVFKEVQSEQSDGESIDGTCGEWDVADTGQWRDCFRNFPTQSPICSRDDGFPGELDGITFSSWRELSVKGYGNAIVPQVMYEILKIIDIL